MNSSRILIVESSFYPEITKELIKGATAELIKAKLKNHIISVPGAFEIPAAIKFSLMADKEKTLNNRFAGYIALGCVIQGETDHYKHICSETTRALMDISINDTIALGFGILTVNSLEQAKVRAYSLGEKNAGGKAALSCIKMIGLKTSMSLITSQKTNESA